MYNAVIQFAFTRLKFLLRVFVALGLKYTFYRAVAPPTSTIPPPQPPRPPPSSLSVDLMKGPGSKPTGLAVVPTVGSPIGSASTDVVRLPSIEIATGPVRSPSEAVLCIRDVHTHR